MGKLNENTAQDVSQISNEKGSYSLQILCYICAYKHRVKNVKQRGT